MKIWVALADMARGGTRSREWITNLGRMIHYFLVCCDILKTTYTHNTHKTIMHSHYDGVFFFFFVFSVFSSLIRATTNTEIVWQSFSFCLLVFFLWLLFFKLCAILWRNAISFGFFLWSYFARTRIPQRRLLNICVCRWIEFLFCIHCTNLHMAFYEHSPVHTNTDRVRWRTGDCVPYVCVSEYNLINKFL